MNLESIAQEFSTACILCSRNCGIRVTREAERFTKIKGDPAHPKSQGYICQKAAKLDFYQHHQDRLTHPLKKNEDGTFDEISWDQAIDEIASRLVRVRDTFGGEAFALVGGGGQGNHLGGAYAQQLRYAMKSRYVYTSLAQEKTMDFWTNGRLFGDQRIHCTEDVEHADYVLFIGCNPFQAHGIPNARHTLKDIQKDPNRTMVVIDPRLTETAKMADIHIAVKPGADAYLMSAILAIIVSESLHDIDFINKHCTGFDSLEKILLDIPIEDYARRADVSLALLQKVARGFAQAQTACVRIDLGLQQSLHSTLTAYLEKMLYLVTGNFAKKGGNNLHSTFLPLLGNSDERNRNQKLTAHHKMMPIAGMYPPNILPDEIEHDGEDRVRAVWVESCNPMMTYADSKAYESAFKKLELLVVVDVAFTETAKCADYILPAASQYEKWEATGFNAEFPENFFHLRPPTMKPLGSSLPEAEIYTRLITKMDVIPKRFPLLASLAKHEPSAAHHQGYFAALLTTLKLNKDWAPYAPSILYRTLGLRFKAKGGDASSAALLLPLAMKYARQHKNAVKRAGIGGNRFTLGVKLFRKIMNSPSGVIISKHRFKDMWRFIKNKDKKIHLEIPEVQNLLETLQELPVEDAEFPLILIAGERRSYNANQIFRNPAWRKTDQDGALRIHPVDAKALEIVTGEKLICKSKKGQIQVVVSVDQSVRPGMVTLPHGYGMQYQGATPDGPALNWLTSGDHCDPFTKTPYHKYVPVKLEKSAF